VPEFGPKESIPVHVDNVLLNFMPRVQFDVEKIKCTLTRRGTTRISADVLFWMLHTKLVLETMLQAPIYCSKCRNYLPSHPLYIRYIERNQDSKILMRDTDFMAQDNFCKRGQDQVSITSESRRNNSSGRTY
jgi:hypothetical protein